MLKTCTKLTQNYTTNHQMCQMNCVHECTYMYTYTHSSRKQRQAHCVYTYYIVMKLTCVWPTMEDTDLLLPMSMMTMLALECCLASSSHDVRCSNVSRLHRERGGYIHVCTVYNVDCLNLVCCNQAVFWQIGTYK